MKKKKIVKVVMVFLLTIGICLSLLPSDIKAVSSSTLVGFPLEIDENTDSIDMLSSKGFKYDKSSKTLELKGVNFSSGIADDYAISFDENSYTIKVIGKNTITMKNPDWTTNCIEAKGSLRFEGENEAELNLNNGGYSAILATGDIVVINSTMNIKGNDDNFIENGIIGNASLLFESSQLNFNGGTAFDIKYNLSINGNSKIDIKSYSNNVVEVRNQLVLSTASSLTLASSKDSGILCNVGQLKMFSSSILHIIGEDNTTAIVSSVLSGVGEDDSPFAIGSKIIKTIPEDYNVPNIAYAYEGLYSIGKTGDTSKFANDVLITNQSEPEVPPTQDPVVPTPDESDDVPSINKDTKHSWNKALGKGLSFKIEGTFTEIKGVEVDKETVKATSYDTDKEAATLTLKKDYLDTLPTGSHGVAILVDDKRVETTFTIEKAEDKTDTNDDSNTSNNNGGNSSNSDTGNTTNNNSSNTVDIATNKKNSPDTTASNIGSISVMIILIGCILSLLMLRKKLIVDQK